MRRINSLIGAILFSLILSGCVDMFEPDISTSNVILLSPYNGMESDTSSISFWWDTVEFATEYQLQIVSPDLSMIEKLCLDTFLIDNQLVYNLEPGDYEWRVRARNASSETNYVTAAFTVKQSGDEE